MEQNPRKKRQTSTKSSLKFFLTSHKLQHHDKIQEEWVSRRKTKRCGTDKIFWNISTNLDNIKPGAYASGVHMRYDRFLRIK